MPITVYNFTYFYYLSSADMTRVSRDINVGNSDVKNEENSDGTSNRDPDGNSMMTLDRVDVGNLYRNSSAQVIRFID